MAAPPTESANSEAPSSKQQRRKRRISGKKLWLFRIIALLFPIVLLCLLEVTFRVIGIGRDLNLVQRLDAVDESRRTHRLNPSIDFTYYNNLDVSGPEPRPFQMPKPKGTYRIICFGGSTVIGFPYASELAFPRLIEHILELQNPGTDFEVLNAGVTSMNSFVVADLIQQSLAADPDLLMVYTGHNEFYGPGGPGSTVLNISPDWLSTVFALRRLRLMQFINQWRPTVPPNQDLMNVVPKDLAIQWNSPTFKAAEVNYRTNLEKVVRTCQSADVDLILSSVACNLRNQSPLRAIWPSDVDMARQPEWETLVTQAEQLLSQSQFADALSQLAEAETICSRHAHLQFRKGQCLEGLREFEKARQAYSLARDYDGARFRAPSTFPGIVAEVAGQGEAENVTFLDVQERLLTLGPPAGPGDELFLEHVHYNFSGHFEVAKLFAKEVQEECLDKQWTEESVPSLTEIREIAGFLPEDDLIALAMSLQVLETAPFQHCLDRKQHERHFVNEISRQYESLPVFRQSVFADLPMDQLSTDAIFHLERAHRRAGNVQFADELTGLQSRRRP